MQEPTEIAPNARPRWKRDLGFQQGIHERDRFSGRRAFLVAPSIGEAIEERIDP